MRIIDFLIVVFFVEFAIDNMRFITYNVIEMCSFEEKKVKNFDIIFYDKPDGTEPALDFIMSLNDKMQARVLRTIKLLSENGTGLREPYSKHLVDGIFEVRAKVGSDIFASYTSSSSAEK